MQEGSSPALAAEPHGFRARAVPCGCCGGRADLVYSEHPGFRVGSTYDLYHCRRCDASHASPLAVDQSIYDVIYENIELVPGYRRYVDYERAVLTSAAPLDHLAEAEDVYWAIRRCLHEDRWIEGLRVLDVGSGPGHLAYSLARAGCEVTGIDVSRVAVERATETFGGLFREADVQTFAREHEGRFDVVTLTEVIEHVPDFRSIVAAALDALKPGGKLLLTTPNKTSFAADAVWATENPPVHLWWFSERSIRIVAETLGCSCRFVDFRDFNAGPGKGDWFADGRRQRVVPFYPPTLDRAGGVITAPPPVRSAREAIRRLLERAHLDAALLAARHRVRTRRDGVSSRRPNLCAVLTKPEARRPVRSASAAGA